MAPPSNGVHIVQAEVTLVVTSMRRNQRWSSYQQNEERDPILQRFASLKELLTITSDLHSVDIGELIIPFLEVIRSEETTGPITGVALSSVNKFLSYGIIDPHSPHASRGIRLIADAVTNARFPATDAVTDEVVLMKIVQVLRTILMTPIGHLLSDDAVCEMMQTCFRICFQKRLSEVLRRSAEQTLVDMIQKLFGRLDEFVGTDGDGNTASISAASVLKRSASVGAKVPEGVLLAAQIAPALALQGGDAAHASPPPSGGNDGPHSSASVASRGGSAGEEPHSPTGHSDAEADGYDVVIVASDIASHQPSLGSQPIAHVAADGTAIVAPEAAATETTGDLSSGPASSASANNSSGSSNSNNGQSDAFINRQGVRFSSQEALAVELAAAMDRPLTPSSADALDERTLVPHGLPCVRELLRFLISLADVTDKNNSDTMLQMGLSLITVALESGGHLIARHASLMELIRDKLCRCAFRLMGADSVPLFLLALRVCFLLFEGLRAGLKFQLEAFVNILMARIGSDLHPGPVGGSRGPPQQAGAPAMNALPVGPVEIQELALDCLVQMCRIPSFVAELYLNYDCDLYCSNLFELLAKFLSKNAFPAHGSLYTTHVLSLNALLAVVDSIEARCHDAKTQPRSGAMAALHSLAVAAKDALVTAAGSLVVGGNRLGDSDKGSRGPLPDSVAGFGTERPARRPVPRKLESCGPPSLDPQHLPTAEELIEHRQRKKLLVAGAEQFNIKPRKGIQFLQEHGLLTEPIDPVAVAEFLRNNPRLDKKMIGEYIGDKNNIEVLRAFVTSYDLAGLRIDEAVRLLLESFRLPGEAQIIDRIIECFADRYYTMNRDSHRNIADRDSAYILAYAIMQLNTDQHNPRVKKPMTIADFIRNQRGVNAKGDYPPDFLELIYNSIKTREIVMPDEQMGAVRDDYQWKVMLQRSASPAGTYLAAHSSAYDQDVFLLAWGPAIAAISYVFETAMDEIIVQRAIAGFRKCAVISGHYGLCDVFDNLVISLCKFTTLLTPPPHGLIAAGGGGAATATGASHLVYDQAAVAFGRNLKAQMAAQTVFALTREYGNMLREGWKNILDCMVQLYRLRLLPKAMLEAEDFADPSGRVPLQRQRQPMEAQRNRGDSSLWSAMSYYLSLSSEPSTDELAADDVAARTRAVECVAECRLEELIAESRFLSSESLREFVKALVFASQGPLAHAALGTQYDADAAVFFLELLVEVTLRNKDRIDILWETVREHLLGIATLSLQPSVHAVQHVHPISVASQHGAAVHLASSGSSSHIAPDAQPMVVVTPLALPSGPSPTPTANSNPNATPNANSNTAGYPPTSSAAAAASSASSAWHVERAVVGLLRIGIRLFHKERMGDEILGALRRLASAGRALEWEGVRFQLASGLQALLKANGALIKRADDWETVFVLLDGARLHPKARTSAFDALAYIVTDAEHIRRSNFGLFVAALNSIAFVPPPTAAAGASIASASGGSVAAGRSQSPPSSSPHLAHHPASQHMAAPGSAGHALSQTASGGQPQQVTPLGVPHALVSVPALLEVLAVLYSRVPSLVAEGPVYPDEIARVQRVAGLAPSPLSGASPAWHVFWCPLLRMMAQLCCEPKRELRQAALTLLQRSLLSPEMRTLSPADWEACFADVLYPLLSWLLDPALSAGDPTSIDETRMRASALACKVFLLHLNLLLTLPAFSRLWLHLLDFTHMYMRADNSELLAEAILESLKNMLLVMSTSGILVDPSSPSPRKHNGNGGGIELQVSQQAQLWEVTWTGIGKFLPSLRGELFPSSIPQAPPQHVQLPSDSHVDVAAAAAAAPQAKGQAPAPRQGQRAPEFSRAAAVVNI